MLYIQRESLKDIKWWNKTGKDVIKDVDCVTNFPYFLWLLQYNDNAERCQKAAYAKNKNVWMSIFASHVETDTILPVFKIYYIIMEFNIFKVTVEPKRWCALCSLKVKLGFELWLFF